MQRTNFNYIALFYDRLCQFVFGNAIKKSQIDLLPFMPTDATVLIIGGGTGWIIDEIIKIRPSGLNVTYVDISSKMIALSKKRNKGMNTFEFIEASIENVQFTEKKYDIILTPFIFDVLPQSSCQQVFEKLSISLKTKGLWLYADFFFRIKANIGKKL